MFLNVRFDTDTGFIVKIDPWQVENLVMTIAILAGVHFMEDQEAEVKRVAGEKERLKLSAQAKLQKSSTVDDLPDDNPFGQAAAWQQVDLGEE